MRSYEFVRIIHLVKYIQIGHETNDCAVLWAVITANHKILFTKRCGCMGSTFLISIDVLLHFSILLSKFIKGLAKG